MREVGFATKNGRLTVSVGLQDLFGEAERERLKSGFATRVLVRAALEEASTGEPVAVAVQRAEIVYDIWDEKFGVRTSDGLGVERRAVAPTADEAIWRAAVLFELPMVDAGPAAARRRVRAGRARRSQPDLRGPADRGAPLAGPAGARSAAPRGR